MHVVSSCILIPLSPILTTSGLTDVASRDAGTVEGGESVATYIGLCIQ